MTVTTESGRRLQIPSHHTVFEPVGDYRTGQAIDPETVNVFADRAVNLLPGRHIIVDNRVEVVTRVTT
jgi:hypothetical protein